MKRFTTVKDFDTHVTERSYPRLLVISARARMELIEECNEGGAQASLIITETPEELAALNDEYHLESLPPEDFSIFGTEGEVWHERVYVFGDDGSGVVIYTKLCER
jgi:hypothetical protein